MRATSPRNAWILPALQHIETGRQDREWRAQLRRGIGGETALLLHANLEPVQCLICGPDQRHELGGQLLGCQAYAGITRADPTGLRGDLAQRPQSPAQTEHISMQDLPPAVAKTVQSELGNKQAEEVEKIRYGIVVLYEAEYYQDGEEYEVYVYPNCTQELSFHVLH